MAILTKPTITKGQPATFTLNKSELAAVSKVSSDFYFSNTANWYRINLVYKSEEGSQYEMVEFDASQTTPTGTFLISEYAKDKFNLLRMEIVDFDGGILELNRSDITPSIFDVDLTPVELPTAIVDFSQPLTNFAYKLWTSKSTISDGFLKLEKGLVNGSSPSISIALIQSPFTAIHNDFYQKRKFDLKIYFQLDGTTSTQNLLDAGSRPRLNINVATKYATLGLSSVPISLTDIENGYVTKTFVNEYRYYDPISGGEEYKDPWMYDVTSAIILHNGSALSSSIFTVFISKIEITEYTPEDNSVEMNLVNWIKTEPVVEEPVSTNPYPSYAGYPTIVRDYVNKTQEPGWTEIFINTITGEDKTETIPNLDHITLTYEGETLGVGCHLVDGNNPIPIAMATVRVYFEEYYLNYGDPQIKIIKAVTWEEVTQTLTAQDLSNGYFEYEDTIGYEVNLYGGISILNFWYLRINKIEVTPL